MRKELSTLVVFFAVIFTAVSILSFHPADPSILNAADTGRIHNFFGAAGAHTAGLLVGLFGLGSLWIPVLLAILGFRVLKASPSATRLLLAAGAVVLILSTSALAWLAVERLSLIHI